MWHASVSLQRLGTFMAAPGRLEKAAIALLRGVGSQREWWYWNPRARVGHLRVGLIEAEVALVPPGCALSDAGESGPERRHRR